MASSAAAPSIASATRRSTRGSRFWLPLLVAASAATFAIGVATGASGAAVRPRSDAEAVAHHEPFTGVAINNMSDAAWAAMNAPVFSGVADNNMSDAARAAQHASFRGVAVNNMSDAVWAATNGRY